MPPGLTAGDRVVHFVVPGPISGVTGSVEVELPAGYAQAGQRSRRYPVLEAFPGYPGGPSTWVDVMNIGGALKSAVAAHRIADPIVIMPTTETPPGRDTECVNGGGSSPQIETCLTQDLPCPRGTT